LYGVLVYVESVRPAVDSTEPYCVRTFNIEYWYSKEPIFCILKH